MREEQKALFNASFYPFTRNPLRMTRYMLLDIFPENRHGHASWAAPAPWKLRGWHYM